MAVLLAPISKNAIQKTLAAQLLSSATTGDPVTFDDVDGIPNLPGVLVINRVDSSGTATASKREYIEYSGTSGTTVLITTRNVDNSNAALTHAVGSIVEFLPDVTWADRIYDALANVINVSTLALDTTKVVDLTTSQTLTNKRLSGGFITGATLTGVNMSSSTINGATLSGILAGNATLPGTITLNDSNFGSRKTTIYNNGNAGASLAVNLNNGETQRLTLTTTLATVSLVNMEEGDYLSLYAIQSSGYSGSIIFAQSGGSIRNVNATIPQLTKSNNAVNLIGIRGFNASISDVVAVSYIA